MPMLEAILLLSSALLATVSVVPFMRYDRWWVRILDFPRLQIAALSVVVLLILAWRTPQGGLFWGSVALAGLALVIQIGYILPYTPLWRKETKDAEGGNPNLTLLIANVLMSNRQADGLLRLIDEQKPDIVVLDEPDQWWEERLRPLEGDYPSTMKDPRPNTYGMLLYSRLPFVEHERRVIVDPEIPSFHICVHLDGRRVRLHFVHPKPPYPAEAKSTTGRNAELVVVGRLAARAPEPTIVAGDLNDVAWSHTTRLFQRVSGLLDPRRGRGMFNTYHAGYFFARWPLDHLFHSEHFRLVRLWRGPAFGSDHFPMLVTLELDSAAQFEQEAPDLRAGDVDEANRTEQRAAAKMDPDE